MSAEPFDDELSAPFTHALWIGGEDADLLVPIRPDSRDLARLHEYARLAARWWTRSPQPTLDVVEWPDVPLDDRPHLVMRARALGLIDDEPAGRHT